MRGGALVPALGEGRVEGDDSAEDVARIGQPAFTHGVDAGGVQKVDYLGAGLAPDRPDPRLKGSHLAYCWVI